MNKQCCKNPKCGRKIDSGKFCNNAHCEFQPQPKECQHELIDESKGSCSNCGESDIRKIMNPSFGKEGVCTYLICPNRGKNNRCEHFQPSQENPPQPKMNKPNPKLSACPTGACPKVTHYGNCKCKCHSSQPKECEHKNPIPCNRNSCDGVEFVHFFHCEDCDVALKPQPQAVETEPVGWEREFSDKFFYDRGDHLEFDVLKQGNVGVLIEFIQNLLLQSLQDERGKMREIIEGMRKSPFTGHIGNDTNRAYDMGQNEGFNQALTQFLEAIKEK